MQFKAAGMHFKFGASITKSTTQLTTFRTVNQSPLRRYADIPPRKWTVQQIPNPRKKGLWISDNSTIFKPHIFDKLNSQIGIS